MNPQVALLCFKGSYYLSKLDTSRAKESFTEAIQLDPLSAESWAGLADTLHTMGVKGDYDAFSQARDAANKALQIDGAQAQALMVLGAVAFLHDWNPTQSEIFFRKSINARPGYAMAHALFADTLAHQGKFEEAIQQIKLASALDPVSVVTNSMAWHVYFSARRYDDALRVILSAIESIPSLNLAIGVWASVGSKKANTRKRSRLFMMESQKRKPRNCATPFPPVGRAATGNASWRFSSAKERPKIAMGFLPLHAVICAPETGRRPSSPWKRVTRCTIRILFFGFQFTRSSIPCAPIRVFKECFTVWAFRDCHAAPADKFFPARIKIYISESSAIEEDGHIRFDLHDSFASRDSAGSERTNHRSNRRSFGSRDGWSECLCSQSGYWL